MCDKIPTWFLGNLRIIPTPIPGRMEKNPEKIAEKIVE